MMFGKQLHVIGSLFLCLVWCFPLQLSAEEELREEFWPATNTSPTAQTSSNLDEELIDLISAGYLDIVELCSLGSSSQLIPCPELNTQLDAYLEARDAAEILAVLFNATKNCTVFLELLSANLSVETHVLTLLESQSFENLHETGYVRFPEAVQNDCQPEEAVRGEDAELAPYLGAWAVLVVILTLIFAVALCLLVLWCKSCNAGVSCRSSTGGKVGQYRVQVDLNPDAANPDVSILSGIQASPSVVIDIDSVISNGVSETDLASGGSGGEGTGRLVEDGEGAGSGGEAASVNTATGHVLSVGAEAEEGGAVVGGGGSGVASNSDVAGGVLGDDEEAEDGGTAAVGDGGSEDGVGGVGAALQQDGQPVPAVPVTPPVDGGGVPNKKREKAADPAGRQIPTRSKTGALVPPQSSKDCRKRVK